MGGGQIIVVDTSTQKVVGGVDIGGTFWGMVALADGVVVVVIGSAGICLFDLSDFM